MTASATPADSATSADSATPADPAALRRAVGEIDWYHTLELAPGLATPGWFDHRSIVHRVPLPASLVGLRCLDVGTFNGFWAFEMERRGASEVVAVDVLDPAGWDWPSGSEAATLAALSERTAGGRGFALAHATLGSTVQRLDRSVYDLSPQELGRFDVVYLGSLLVHLRDPVRALERVREVCAGTLVVVDGIDLEQSLLHPRAPLARLDGRGRPWWWYPNAAGLRRLVESAGFTVQDGPRTVFVPAGAGWRVRRLHPRSLRTRAGRNELVVAWRGDPHAALVARPAR